MGLIFILNDYYSWPKTNLTDNFSAVCEGQGAKEAGEFAVGSEKFTKILLMEKNTFDNWEVVHNNNSVYEDWEGNLPRQWISKSANEIDAVACIEDDWIEVKRCGQYGNQATGTYIIIYDVFVDVTLRKAKTGTLIAKRRFSPEHGELKCPSFVTQGSNVDEYPDNDLLRQWLKGYYGDSNGN